MKKTNQTWALIININQIKTLNIKNFIDQRFGTLPLYQSNITKAGKPTYIQFLKFIKNSN